MGKIVGGKMKSKFLLIVLGTMFSIMSYATDQIILKFKPSSSIGDSESSTLLPSSEQIQHLADVSGYKIKCVRPLTIGAVVVKFNENLTTSQMQLVISKLQAESSIEYVVEDKLLQHFQSSKPDVQ